MRLIDVDQLIQGSHQDFYQDWRLQKILEKLYNINIKFTIVEFNHISCEPNIIINAMENWVLDQEELIYNGFLPKWWTQQTKENLYYILSLDDGNNGSCSS